MRLSLARLAKVITIIMNVVARLAECQCTGECVSVRGSEWCEPHEAQMLLSHGPKSRWEWLDGSTPLVAASWWGCLQKSFISRAERLGRTQSAMASQTKVNRETKRRWWYLKVSVCFLVDWVLLFFFSQPVLHGYFRSSCSWRVRIGELCHSIWVEMLYFSMQINDK